MLRTTSLRVPRALGGALRASLSTVANSAQVYCSQNEIPLVRTEFLPDKRVWVMTMLGEETKDNRMTHTLISEGLLPALRDVRRTWTRWARAGELNDGAALVTTALAGSKIFSNGLDLLNALKDPYFFNEHLNTLSRELLTFPVPTVAAIGGHAFAAGFTFALAHDYRVMNSERGYVCMNEIEFGAHIPRGMLGVIKSVAPTPSVLRKIVLEGHRFSAQAALADGLVDATAPGAESTLEQAIALAEKLRTRAAKDAYQVIREHIKHEAIEMQYEPPRSALKTELQ